MKRIRIKQVKKWLRDHILCGKNKKVIRGHMIKAGYFICLLTILTGLGDILHVSHIASKNGIPNSVNVDIVYFSNFGSALCAIFVPIVCLYLLLRKNPALYSVIWFATTFGIALSSIVIVRAGFWMNFSHQERSIDMMDYTTSRVSKGKKPGRNMIYTSRVHKCCGVLNYSDWEAIYQKVDAEDLNEGKGRPRKVPEFCCKTPRYGCGTRYLDEIIDSIEQIVSACQDPDVEHHTACRTNAQNLATGKLDKNNVSIIYIEDSRIDPLNSKKSIGDLPEVIEICKGQTNSTDESTEPIQKQVMIYYRGFVQWVPAIWEHGLETNFSRACSPLEVHNDRSIQTNNPAYVLICHNQTVPIASFHHTFGFCNWKEGKTNIKSFTSQERMQLVRLDKRLYYKGCRPHLEKYIDTVAYYTLLYNLVLIIQLFFLMFFYHFAYTEFREDQILTAPTPRWYEPMQGEPTLTGFGDVKFIPDNHLVVMPQPNLNPALYPRKTVTQLPLGPSQLDSQQAIGPNQQLPAIPSKLVADSLHQMENSRSQRMARKPRKSQIKFVFK